MLQNPISEDLLAECGALSIATGEATNCAGRRMVAMLPEGSSCIGAGAFGTVRLGWVQERKYFRHRGTTRGDEDEEFFTIVPGTCAAVAVKRVAVPYGVGNATSLHRQQLLCELQVMERIRMHPHPNVVQCWGFLFGYKNHEKHSNPHNLINNDDELVAAGEVLTNFTKEQKRWGCDKSDEAYKHIFDRAFYVDLCLSLCTGGSLKEYVHRKALSASRVAGVVAHGEVTLLQASHSAATSGKISLKHTSLEHGLTGSTTEGTLSCGAGGDQSGGPLHGDSSTLRYGNADYMSEDVIPSHVSDVFTAEIAIWERDIVAILYALVNALRHTHEVLMTLHRDIKPANVLICDGVGRTPVYALQPSLSKKPSTDVSSKSDVSSSTDNANSVELVLFSDYQTAMGGPTRTQNRQCPSVPDTENKTGGEKPATLVVPLTAGRHFVHCRRKSSPPLYVEYLPQAEGWRIQLADFGVSSGVGHLLGTSRCGTIPFVAPEVLGDRTITPTYDSAADIYSLGVTLQYMLVNLVIDGTNATQTAHRRIEALGAQWIDEDDAVAVDTQNLGNEGFESDTATASATRRVTTETEKEEEKQKTFVVPSAWRCEKEISSGKYIRYTRQKNSHSDIRSAEGSGTEHESARNIFVVPRSWRCRDELLKQSYVRHDNLPTGDNDDIHSHLLAPLPDGPEDAEEFAIRGRRRPRCRSCGKYHRHIVELLNAMTAKQPSQRPTLSTILQSAAIIEQGSFVSTDASFRRSEGANDCDSGKLFPRTGTLEGNMSVDQFFRVRQRACESSRSDPPHFVSQVKTTASEQRLKKGEEKIGGKDVVDGEEDRGHGNSTQTLLWRPPSLRFLLVSGGA